MDLSMNADDILSDSDYDFQYDNDDDDDDDDDELPSLAMPLQSSHDPDEIDDGIITAYSQETETVTEAEAESKATTISDQMQIQMHPIPVSVQQNSPIIHTSTTSSSNHNQKDSYTKLNQKQSSVPVPHRGSLCRNKLQNNTFQYTLAIQRQGTATTTATATAIRTATRTTSKTATKYTLQFSFEHYEFLDNIFTILDTDSSGFISQLDLQEFVLLRCPVFKRRDRDLALYRQHAHFDPLEQESQSQSQSQAQVQARRLETTFQQVWNSVMTCAMNYNGGDPENYSKLGLEGWILFARFISLAQYHDAKRRFSARHLQTAGGGGNDNGDGEGDGDGEGEGLGHKEEMVIVDLPPLKEPPMELNVENLCEYDLFTRRNMSVTGEDTSSGYQYGTFDEEGIPLPELDLDHSYISVHDYGKKNVEAREKPLKANAKVSSSNSMTKVKVSVFGSSHLQSSSGRSSGIPSSSVGMIGGGSGGSGSASNFLEFVIRYSPTGHGPETNERDVIIVRRSIHDLQWLHETFQSHKQLGGTLCGRILPPFPSKLGSANSDYNAIGIESSSTNSTSTAVAVASAGVSAGVEIVNSAAKTAKSLWGSIPGSKKISKIVKATTRGPAQQVSSSRAFSKMGYRKHAKNVHDSPQSKARQIEKYLNYLLEHPALSTSFPLNLILKTSQSGLDASKRILNRRLQTSSISTIAQEVNMDEKHMSLASAFFQYLPSPSNTKNLEWVRSAAQAALVLKVHGLLETAGYQSTSTTLQHASLPQFASNNDHEGMDSSGANENADVDAEDSDDKDCISELGNESNDEYDGFDVLPHPLPLPERSALCAGSVYPSRSVATVSETRSYSTYTHSLQDRDHYGTMQHTSLGDIEVERDIERLRDLLRRVDKSFSSCCNALVTINEHRGSKELVHVNILRSIDDWLGMRGKILSQRSLLNGVACLEEANRAANDSYTSFGEDMMWSASLASSAYTASKDVCRAVKAAQTASRAKQTADIAVHKAVTAERETCANDEEAKVLHERVSSSKMQALHAAVVDHEASSAKRRSVVSLANDVKYWNTHRKRELLKACLDAVKEQRSSAEKNIHAWEQLRDGLLDTHQIFGKGETPDMTENAVEEIVSEGIVISEPCEEQFNEFDYPSSSALEFDDDVDEGIQITGGLAESAIEESFPKETEILNDIQQDYFTPSASHNGDLLSDDFSLKSADGEDHTSKSPHLSQDTNDRKLSISGDFEDTRFFTDAMSTSAQSHHSETSNCDVEADASADNEIDGVPHDVEKERNEGMTESMQSLVDGLLTWGENWDAEDDLALPRGMAASLVMEERGMFDLQ